MGWWGKYQILPVCLALLLLSLHAHTSSSPQHSDLAVDCSLSVFVSAKLYVVPPFFGYQVVADSDFATIK